MTLILLILGGTQEASELALKAGLLPHIEVKLSLAGRTRQAVASKNTRVGGFGGVAGLTQYLQEAKIDLLIDATHPFAAQISENAAIAANQLGLPRLILVRPPWEPVIGDKPWIEVENIPAAAAILLPWGCHAMQEKPLLAPWRICVTFFAFFHKQSQPSAPPEASIKLSGANSIASTIFL